MLQVRSKFSIEIEHIKRHCFSLKSTRIGDRTSLSIAKNHPKTSQEVSEQFGPSTHKIKGFSKNSHQKVHLNFAKILGRQILGNTLSGPNRKVASGLGPSKRAQSKRAMTNGVSQLSTRFHTSRQKSGYINERQTTHLIAAQPVLESYVSWTWDPSFPLEGGYNIPRPENPGKLLKKLQFGPPRACPEITEKKTKKRVIF